MCHVVLCPQLGTGPPNEARRLQPHHRHHCRRPHRQGSPFQLSRARVLFCREQSLVRIDSVDSTRAFNWICHVKLTHHQGSPLLAQEEPGNNLLDHHVYGLVVMKDGLDWSAAGAPTAVAAMAAIAPSNCQ